MPVKIKSTLGSVTLAAENVSGDTTLTVPSGTGTVATTADVPTSIVDNGNATAITIDANENVGIGTTTPAVPLEVKGGASSNWNAHFESTNATGWGTKIMGGADGGDYSLLVKNYADTSLFEVRADGRGLSQFTAKAWVNFNGTGTVAIRDSHNVSSITDNGTGDYTVNFTNAMSNANYSAVAQAGGSSGIPTTKLTGTGGSLVTTEFTLQTINAANLTTADWANIYAQVFGD